MMRDINTSTLFGKNVIHPVLTGNVFNSYLVTIQIVWYATSKIPFRANHGEALVSHSITTYPKS